MSQLSSLSPRWLLLAGVILLLGYLNYAPLWNPDEGRYAAASLEMAGGLENGRPGWVVPHLNTVPRLNKPPLIYWLTGSSFKLFGPSEWTARLAPALATALVMFIMWSLGRSMFDEKTGLAAALIWSTLLLSAALGRTCNTDMVLCAAMTIVFYGIWLALGGVDEESAKPTRHWRGYLIAGVGIGLAILSKGPVGVALPLLIGFSFLLVTKSWKRVNWPGFIVALLIGVAVAVPWFLAIEKREPGFSHRFLVEENLGRFSGKEEYHKASPFWFYVPVTLLSLLPWTAFLGAAVSAFFLGGTTKERQARWFLWLWAGVIIVFFSNSSTKLFSYILPALPALSLLLADGILRRVGKLQWTLWLLWAVNAAGAIGAIIFLSDNKTLPRDVGLPYALAAGAIALICAALGTKFWKQGDGWKVAVSQFGGAVALYACVLSLAGTISLYEDSSAIFRTLAPHMKPGDSITETSSFQPTAIFYARRPISFVNFSNTSGLDEDVLKNSPLFITLLGKDLTPLFQKRERVFVLLRWRRKDYTVPSGIWTWARNNDYKLISNQPPPKDFRFDFTAPHKAQEDTDTAYGPLPVP